MWSIYQWETVLPLAVMVLTYSFFWKKPALFLTTAAFILLTKEDYIPLSIGLYIWIGIAHLLSKSKEPIPKRYFFILALIFVVCTWVSVSTLQHFKAMNAHNIVNRNASFSSMLTWGNITGGKLWDWGLPATTVYTSLSAMGALLVLLKTRSWTAISFLMFTIISFVYLRLVGDRLIYFPTIHNMICLAPGLEWANWARCIIPPMLGLGTTYSLSLCEPLSKKPILISILSAWLILSCLLINWQYPPILYKVARNQPMWPTGKAELQERRELISQLKDESRTSLILIPNYCWELHLNHMTVAQYHSEVSTTLEDTSLNPLFHRWLDQADYIILIKSFFTEKAQAQLPELKNFNIIKQSTQYLLFKRDETKQAAIKLKKRYW
jgi:hypothetical protein